MQKLGQSRCFQDKRNLSLRECAWEGRNSERDENRASEKVGGKSLEHRPQEGQPAP